MTSNPPAKPKSVPSFGKGDPVVYPAHGVGTVADVVDEVVMGATLRLLVIDLAKERMTVRVPLAKVAALGLRGLASPSDVDVAEAVLKTRPRVSRLLWSRRAAECEAKVATGSLVAMAEVARDLFRSETKEEASYSQKRIYAVAMDRLASEASVVRGTSEAEERRGMEALLEASVRGRGVAADDAGERADDTGERADQAA